MKNKMIRLGALTYIAFSPLLYLLIKMIVKEGYNYNISIKETINDAIHTIKTGDDSKWKPPIK